MKMSDNDPGTEISPNRTTQTETGSPSQTRLIRLLIVDDQQLFAESLSLFLTNYAPEIRVVGIASGGRQAIDLAARLSPDVILMDVYMPGINGVQATARIRAQNPRAKILMLSTYDEDNFVHQALECGASGYVLKDISPTELIACVRALQSGMVQISPQIAQRLVGSFDGENRLTDKKLSERFPAYHSLAQREKEIFFLMATSFDNVEIAKKLGLSERTVRNYVSSVYSKLEVSSRFEIIQLANKLQSEP